MIFERCCRKGSQKSRVFGDLDFGGVLEGFWEGFGRPKSSILALFSMFFRSPFRRAFQKSKKSAQETQQDAEGGFWGLDSGHPQAPGERKREGYKIFALHKELGLSDSSVMGQDVSESDLVYGPARPAHLRWAAD